MAQDFIRRCLQYRKEDRADVFELAKHELFRPRGAVRFFLSVLNLFLLFKKFKKGHSKFFSKYKLLNRKQKISIFMGYIELKLWRKR